MTNKFARSRDVEMAITRSWEVQMGCLEHNDEINSTPYNQGIVHGNEYCDIQEGRFKTTPAALWHGKLYD